jgi:hypothetical protein
MRRELREPNDCQQLMVTLTVLYTLGRVAD